MVVVGSEYVMEVLRINSLASEAPRLGLPPPNTRTHTHHTDHGEVLRVQGESSSLVP